MLKSRKRGLFNTQTSPDGISVDDSLRQIESVWSSPESSVFVKVSSDSNIRVFDGVIENFNRSEDETGTLFYISGLSEKLEQQNIWKKHQSLQVSHLEDVDIMRYSGKEKRLVLGLPAKFNQLITQVYCRRRTDIFTTWKVLIDDGHLLNDDNNGSELESVITCLRLERVKMMFVTDMDFSHLDDLFIWLNCNGNFQHFTLNEAKFKIIEKLVEGFRVLDGKSEFGFDISLNYKLITMIKKHSNNRPVLVYCSCPEQIELAKDYLIKNSSSLFGSYGISFNFDKVSAKVKDASLKVCLKNGIGFLHQGLHQEDQDLIETCFREGYLPVLLTTQKSVNQYNLSPFLIIVKGTQFYQNGVKHYDQNILRQMIKHLGSLKFDNRGKFIVMTAEEEQERYKSMLNTRTSIESSLHKNFSSFLNQAIATRRLMKFDDLMDFSKQTFFYKRFHRNPQHYGLQDGEQLKQVLVKAIKQLERQGLVRINIESFEPTESGIVAAVHGLSFETLREFKKITDCRSLRDVLMVLCRCEKEFSAFQLRKNEKRILNLINESSKPSIRYQFNDLKGKSLKIISLDMKISCLIQAKLGFVDIEDNLLEREAKEIVAIARKLCHHLSEYLHAKKMRNDRVFSTILNLAILQKCLDKGLWENSKMLLTQIPNMNETDIMQCAFNELTSWKRIDEYIESNPDGLTTSSTEQLRAFISKLPRYEVHSSKCVNDARDDSWMIKVQQKNPNCEFSVSQGSLDLIIGDRTSNRLLLLDRDINLALAETGECHKIVKANQSTKIDVHLIYSNFAGCDVLHTINLPFIDDDQMEAQENIPDSNERHFDEEARVVYQVVEIIEPQTSQHLENAIATTSVGDYKKTSKRLHGNEFYLETEPKHKKPSHPGDDKIEKAKAEEKEQIEHASEMNEDCLESNIDQNSSENEKKDENCLGTKENAVKGDCRLEVDDEFMLITNAFSDLKLQFCKQTIAPRTTFNDAETANKIFCKLFEKVLKVKKSVIDPALQEIVDSCAIQVQTPKSSKILPRHQMKKFVESQVGMDKGNEMCISAKQKPKEPPASKCLEEEFDLDLIFQSDEEDERTANDFFLPTSLRLSSKLLKMNQSQGRNVLERIFSDNDSISQGKENISPNCNFTRDEGSKIPIYSDMKQKNQQQSVSKKLPTIAFKAPRPVSAKQKLQTTETTLGGIKSLTEKFKFQPNRSFDSLNSSSSGNGKLQLKTTNMKNRLNASLNETRRDEKLRGIQEKYENHRDMSKYLDDFCITKFIEQSQ